MVASLKGRGYNEVMEEHEGLVTIWAGKRHRATEGSASLCIRTNGHKPLAFHENERIQNSNVVLSYW